MRHGPKEMEARRVRQARYRVTDKGRHAQRNGWLRHRYGITVDDFDRMLRDQDGKCAICGTTEPGGRRGVFAVDHDHQTGRVRGLLCFPCNRRLGVLEMFGWRELAERYLARGAS